MEIVYSERKGRPVKRIKLRWLPYPGAKPSATQLAVTRNLKHRNIYMIGGLGSGKTASAAYKACQLSIINKGLIVGAVGQSYKAAKKDLFPAIDLVLRGSGLKPRRDYNFHKTEHRFDIWAWDGCIQGSSAEDPDILVGDTWAAAVANEPGLWPEQSYLNLLARVRDPHAKLQQIGLFGTPEGMNWFYRRSTKQYPNAHINDDDPDARIYFASTREATWLGNYADHLTDVYSDDLIKEKIDGQFINVGVGQVYAKFNRADHVDDFPLFEGAPLCLALDFNIAPGIALVCQVVPHPKYGPILYVHDVIWLDRGSTADVMHEVNRRYPVRLWAKDFQSGGDWTERMHYCGDATGKAVHATGLSCYAEVRRVLEEAGWGVHDATPNVNPPVSDRVAVMNGAFEKFRICVHSRCDTLIDDLEMVTFIAGTRRIDKKKDKTLTHTSDGLGYLVHELFGRRMPDPTVTVAKGKGSIAGGIADAPWHDKDKGRRE